MKRPFDRVVVSVIKGVLAIIGGAGTGCVVHKCVEAYTRTNAMKSVVSCYDTEMEE